MIDAAHILRPLPLPRIKRSRQQKFLFRMTPGRLQKEIVKLLLTIRCVGAHVAQIAGKFTTGFHATINIRIDATVERPSHANAKIAFEFLQNASAGKREHQVKRRNLVRPHVFDSLTSHVF